MSCIEADYLPYHADIRLGRGSALVFAPHPDDEVFGCAGAILRHVTDGDAVRVVIVTDGAFGAGGNRPVVAATRQAESRAAATVLGYGEPVFWGLPDRGLVPDAALIQRVADELLHCAPAWIYAPSWWEIHPDHTGLSLAVTEAMRRGPAAARLVLYEIGVPLQPNRLLDISEGLECKRAAMACFSSQLERQSYDSHVLALNRYRTFTLPATVRAAEAYRVIARDELPLTPRAPLASPMVNVAGFSGNMSELALAVPGMGVKNRPWRWLLHWLRGQPGA